MPDDNPNIVIETRRDRGELLSARVMPNGTLLVEGRIAKPGILEYIREDGSTQRELIRASELHKADSLRTLGRVAVTLEHPPEDVTPRNVQRFGVGDVDGDIRVDDEGFVRIKMAVRREDAILAIRKGKQELSPGYALRLDTTGGVDAEFGAYDAEQLDRVYNHAAFTDMARGGNDIRINFDGVDAVQVVHRTDSTYQIIENHEDSTMDPELVQLLTLLGVTRVDNQTTAINQAIQGLTQSRADAAAEKLRTDASDLEFEQLKKDFADAESKRDQFKGELETMKKEREDAELEEEKKADAAERVELNKRADALQVEHTDSIDNKTLRRSLAAKVLGREIREDESDGFVRGILAAQPASRSPWAAVSTEATNLDAQRRDGKGPDGELKPKNHNDSFFAQSDAALEAGRGGA